jgi:hypothetical protein
MAQQMANGNQAMQEAVQTLVKVASADTELITEPGKPKRARKVLQ